MKATLILLVLAVKRLTRMAEKCCFHNLKRVVWVIGISPQLYLLSLLAFLLKACIFLISLSFHLACAKGFVVLHLIHIPISIQKALFPSHLMSRRITEVDTLAWMQTFSLGLGISGAPGKIVFFCSKIIATGHSQERQRIDVQILVPGLLECSGHDTWYRIF